uniref:DUF834 domain-containing protein n=1 Tax=Oryza punctata TaxID=4537 RepID=A0A0E0KAW2_ORYPU
MAVTRTSSDVVWTVGITENAAAGDELRRDTGGGGCGSRRRAPTWDMDSGTTGDDALSSDAGERRPHNPWTDVGLPRP